MQNLEALKQHLAEVINLNGALSLLHWDQQVNMPPGGAPARAEQIATLTRLAHEQFTSAKTGELLQAAAEDVAGLDAASNEAAMIRVAQHDYDLQTRLPAALVSEIARVTSHAHETWAKARQDADFSQFAPTLETIFDLMRQKAEAYGYEDRPYDALLDEYEPHMKTRDVERLFDELRAELVPFVAQVFDRLDAVDSAPAMQPFAKQGQEEFGLLVARRIGYDFDRGSLDEAVHPFTMNLSVNDVRITTRFLDNGLDSLSSTVHEVGHALYEQGSDQALEGTVLAGGTSLGVHESQSRMWENIVGRSRDYWHFFYPHLQAIFPRQLGDVSVEDWYRAYNAASRSLIRVESDEVTYNLHIMLRFEMENLLLNGELAVADARDLWNTRMQEYMGITPPDDGKHGILQDVHWSSGLVGYFPTYSLGNFLSVQYWEKALADVPEIPTEIQRGNFAPLLNWLIENIHVHGRKLWPADLTRQVTGEEIQVGPFLRYLKAKYSDIYGIS